MKTVKKAVAALCLMTMFVLFTFTAFAADNTQMLTVRFGRNGEMISGSTVRIYRLGTLGKTPEGEDTILAEGDFETLPIDYVYTGTQDLADIALTLEGIVSDSKITPAYLDVTDEKGEADFDGAAFPEGAYLVVASIQKVDGVSYVPAASVISLPYIKDGQKFDVVTMELKYETQTEHVSRKVLKVWKNDREDMRNEKVSVSLLCNGSVYDTVELSEENGWSFRWDFLSPDYRWTVVERNVSTKYTVRLTFEGITFVVTNDGHLPPDEPLEEESTTNVIPPNRPGGPEYEDPSHRPSRPSHPDDDHHHDDDEEDELPYTGTNIRFVPYFAIIGTLFFICGYASFRKGELADEQE